LTVPDLRFWIGLAARASIREPEFGTDRSARSFPHEWREGDPDQQSFGIEEAADCLTPGFFLVLHEHAMSSRFELRRRLLDIINVEFEPGVRDGNLIGPGILPEA
jgi:hypothetical protein